MLGPKGGFRFPAVQARLPPSRSIYAYIFRTRFLASVALTVCVITFWRSISTSATDMQKFYCFGPSKSPMEMTPNDASDWSGFDTPVVFNHHTPLEINSSTIAHFDLNPIKSTADLDNKERVLILTPLRDADKHLERYFELLVKLTYPHDLIDLGFLVGDSSDTTMAKLSAEVDRVQRKTDNTAFRSVKIIQKDFGSIMYSQDVEARHGFESQAPRRKAMGRARNYLLSSALGPDHSWVYWRDVDIVDSPPPIIQDMILHDKDIIVPNIWFHRYKNDRDIEGRFDYNSWQESPEGLALAASLPKDTILVEGYEEVYVTNRTYMATMGHWTHNKDEEIELDGIGGVSIMVKADVHRSGINFPCYAFENQAETEGFAKMAKRAGYQVIGLPNYVVWHIDTEEKPRDKPGEG